jgi:hypothetical protein
MKFFIVIIFHVSLAILIFSGCIIHNEMEAPHVGQDRSTVRLDMSSYVKEDEGDIYINLEFAAHGESYLLFWTTTPCMIHSINYTENIDLGLGLSIIFNLSGGKIDAVNEKGEIMDAFVDMFPKTTYRQKFGEYLKGSGHWVLSNDGKFCVKSPDKYDPILQPFKHPVELWNVSTKELVWRAYIKDPTIVLLQFIDFQGKECILIGCTRKIYIFYKDDGQLVKEIETYFTANKFSFVESRRLLAFGAFTGKRVDIFSLNNLEKPLYQINPSSYRSDSKKGHWKVRTLNFSADGKFLITQFLLTGLHGKKPNMDTEIYNMDTMKICWQENTLNFDNVTISPNGKKIAFMCGNILEMCDFKPLLVE